MRKTIVSLTGLAAAVAGLAFVYFLLPSEPVYQGKPLTRWLEQFGTNHWSAGHGGDSDRQAEAALQHIGTNAAPIYLQMMTAKESSLKVKWLTLVQKPWLAPFHIPSVVEYRNQVYLRNSLGAFGFVALGEKAKPFVPALIAFAGDEDRIKRRVAVSALGQLGPTASAAWPVMVKYLNDPDETVRALAAMGLGEIHQEPEKSIRILMDFIEQYRTDRNYRFTSQDAILSLGKFGPQAKPAIPMLIGLLRDPQEYIRDAATNALKEIDPDAAAKAGVQ
jgi:hypothetical protein